MNCTMMKTLHADIRSMVQLWQVHQGVGELVQESNDGQPSKYQELVTRKARANRQAPSEAA